MIETLFIIPGFKEKISDKQYVALRKAFLQRGIRAILVPIVWDRRTLTDWIEQFSLFFKKNCSEKNSVLGFSFGAMIALFSAQSFPLHRLFLCSLSPYFSEDLAHIPNWWKHFIGKRRVEDFSRYSMRSIVRGLKVETKVFIGGAEREKFLHLKKRCLFASRALHAPLIIIPDVLHDIGDVRYRTALVDEFEK